MSQTTSDYPFDFDILLEKPARNWKHIAGFAVIQTVLGAGIAGAYIAGLAQLAFHGVTGYLCTAMLVVFSIGLLCALLERWKDVTWLASQLVRLGLLGTVIGLLVAFSVAGASLNAGPDAMRGVILGAINGIYISLWLTLMGVGSALWLKLNARLLGGRYE